MGVNAIIVQARMGSSRLPGKVLADLDGTPLLARLVRRLRGARLLPDVVVATTDLPQDDVVADVAAAEGAHVYRGDPLDVLGRFCAAAEALDVRLMARVSADSPFLDAATVDLVASSLAGAGVDIAAEPPQAGLAGRHGGRGLRTCVSRPPRHHCARAAGSGARHDLCVRASASFTTRWVPPPERCRAEDLSIVVDVPEDLVRARALQERIAADAPLGVAVAAARVLAQRQRPARD